MSVSRFDGAETAVADNSQDEFENPQSGGAEPDNDSDVGEDLLNEAIQADGMFNRLEESSSSKNDDLELKKLKDKVAELEAKASEANDNLLRKAADFDNYRKRMNIEKQRQIEFANESLLLDVITVIDDFERAIQSAESNEELTALPAGKAMLDGITMIEKSFTSQLESKWGLKRFASAGGAFDPNIHEAVFVEKSGDVSEPTVTEDFVRGYMLKDRVIRAAKVKVVMPEGEN